MTKKRDQGFAQYGVPTVDADALEPHPPTVRQFPADLAFRHHILPVRIDGPAVILAMVDPSNLAVIDDVKHATGLNVESVAANAAAVARALRRFYPPSA